MWVMSVLTRSVSSGWTTRPGRLSTRRMCSSLIKDREFGLVEGEKGVFRCGGLEKLVVDIKLEQVPWTRRTSRFAPCR